MAFPFAFVPGFRQQLILAIGTSSLASAAAFSCESAPRRTDEQAPGQRQGSDTAAAPMKPAASSAGMSAADGSKSPAATAGKTAAGSTSGGAPGVGGAGAGVSGASGVGASGMSGASGTGTTGTGVSGAGASGASGSGGQGGVSAPMCMFQMDRACFPRAQMEAQVKFGCGMLANPPARFTDAEVQQHFLPNGCPLCQRELSPRLGAVCGARPR